MEKGYGWSAWHMNGYLWKEKEPYCYSRGKHNNASAADENKNKF